MTTEKQNEGGRHSPLPWAWISPENEHESPWIEDANGKLVLDFGDHHPHDPSSGTEPNESDRDYILRALNSHEALVKALEGFVKLYENPDPNYVTIHDQETELLKRTANAALTLAREGGR